MGVVAVFHLIFIFALIGLVLIQDSKGGALGAFGGGGGSSSVFGASGGANFLVKATTVVAILFAITCLTLTYETSHKKGSVVDSMVPAAGGMEVPIEKAPVEAAPTKDAAPESE